MDLTRNGEPARLALEIHAVELEYGAKPRGAGDGEVVDDIAS